MRTSRRSLAIYRTKILKSFAALDRALADRNVTINVRINTISHVLIELKFL